MNIFANLLPGPLRRAISAAPTTPCATQTVIAPAMTRAELVAQRVKKDAQSWEWKELLALATLSARIIFVKVPSRISALSDTLGAPRESLPCLTQVRQKPIILQALIMILEPTAAVLNMTQVIMSIMKTALYPLIVRPILAMGHLALTAARLAGLTRALVLSIVVWVVFAAEIIQTLAILMLTVKELA